MLFMQELIEKVTFPLFFTCDWCKKVNKLSFALKKKNFVNI